MKRFSGHFVKGIALNNAMSFPSKFAARSIGQRFALSIGAGAGLIMIALATANYFSSREVLLQLTSSQAIEAVHDQVHTMDDLVDRLAVLPMAIGANQVAAESSGGVTPAWLAALLDQCPQQTVFGLYMILDQQDWKTTEVFRWVNRKSWPGTARLNYDFHDPSHDWYTGAKNTTGTYVSHPYFAGGGSEIEMISITRAVYDRKGAFIGVAGVDVALDEIQKMVARMRIRESSQDFTSMGKKTTQLFRRLLNIQWELHESAYLITSNGSLIARPEITSDQPADSIVGKSLALPGMKKILAKSSGSLRVQDRGDKMLYWAEVQRTGWKLILEAPYGLIVAPARALAIESIAIGGIGLILLLGVCFAVARRVSSPIRELQSVASSFEKGSYEENSGVLARIARRPDELGHFATSFSTMVRELRLREESLSLWNANLEVSIEERTADLERAMQAVTKSNSAMAAELSEAAAYARAVLPGKLTGKVATDWVFETSSQLGGDSFGYHWIDDDHLALYLLDVCGHGVGAALLSVSVVNLLRTASLTDTDFLNPSSVLSSLNETFPMERHNDMYFTAWYGVYTHSERTIRFACGGHPPAILINTMGEPLQLGAKGPIVGAFPQADYETASAPVPEGSRLYLFSDGVYEIDRPDLPMMGYDDFVRLLCDAGGGAIAAIVAEIKRQQESDSFVDDFSLVEFNFQAVASPPRNSLTLRNNMEEWDTLLSFTQEFARHHGISQEDLVTIDVILEEIVTNILKYGGMPAEAEACTIRLILKADLLEIIISDKGDPFNPLLLPEVDTDKAIEDRPIGGLGVHFVKKLTISQDYEYRHGQNVLTIVKKLGKR